MEQAMFVILAVSGLAFGIESNFLHTRVGGRIKRGIRVWSEPLVEDARIFLLDLENDIVEKQWGRWPAFVLKRSDAVLIHYPQMRGWKPALCVGYIDLKERWPRIQYRVPFSFALLVGVCFIFLAWVTLHIVVAGVVCMVGLSLVFLWGFRDERRRILEFLLRKMVGERA